MRIDEIDNKHSKFKEAVLDHNLTEEQLDEILPALGAIGMGLARGAMAAGSAVARGAGALARGVGSAASALGRTAGKVRSTVGRTATNTAKNTVKRSMAQGSDSFRSYKKDTANRLANQGKTQGTRGTQGTIGSQNSTTPQADLKRGQTVELPQPDPKNPNKTVPTKMKVKSVSGRDVELQPQRKKQGQPSSVKFAKKDLQSQ